MPRLHLPTVLGACALIAAGFALGRAMPGPSPASPQEVLAQLHHTQAIRPCFDSAYAAMVHANLVEDHVGRLGQPAPTKGQARRDEIAGTIPEGFEQGFPIPKDCFAVQTGLFGVASTYWRQPSTGPRMPAWNPLPDADVAPVITRPGP